MEPRVAFSHPMCVLVFSRRRSAAQGRRPGRTHDARDSFPSHHPLAYDPAAAWSLPVKAAAADRPLVRPDRMGRQARTEPSRNGLTEPWGPSRSAPPDRGQRPCRPTRRPTPRPYRQFRGAHGGAPVFSPSLPLGWLPQSAPTTTTGAPRWPACAGPPLPPLRSCVVGAEWPRLAGGGCRVTEFPGSAGASLHE
jgi:hypothetical protein